MCRRETEGGRRRRRGGGREGDECEKRNPAPTGGRERRGGGGVTPGRVTGGTTQ